MALRSTAARRLPILALAAGLALNGCEAEDPFGARVRDGVEYKTFPDEVYAILVRELELAEPRALAADRVAVLHARRSADPADSEGQYVKEALRDMVAPPVQRGLRPVLESKANLELYDNGNMLGLANFLAAVLDRMLLDTTAEGGSSRVPDALASLAAAKGGSNPDALIKLIHAVSSVEQVLVPRRGLRLGEGGLEQADAELLPGLVDLYSRFPGELERFHDWLAKALQDIEDPAGDVAGEVDPLARRLLEPACGGLRDEGVAEACNAHLDSLQLGAPAWTVLLRPDGTPELGRRATNPELEGVPPFANRSKGVERRSVEPDDYGLAYDPQNNRPVYHYSDLKRSHLGLMLDLSRRFLERAHHWQLVTALPALMGDRRGLTEGFNPANNLLLDLVWVLKELRSYPRWPILLKVIAEATSDGSGAKLLEETLAALGQARSLMGGVDVLTPLNNLFDDLVGENGFRHLEIGKNCGHPPNQADPCSASWLECLPTDEPGRDGICSKVPGMDVPSVLEEMAEWQEWTDPVGNLIREEPLLRKILRSMAEDVRLRDMARAMAVMMANSLKEGNGPYETAALECSELNDSSIEDMHRLQFPPRRGTEWDQPEARLDPELPETHRLDRTRSLHQKLWALVYDTNRAYYDPKVFGYELGAIPIPNLATFYLDAAADNVDISADYLDGDPDESVFETGLNLAAGNVMCEMSLADSDGETLTPTAEQVDLFILRNHVTPDDPIGDIGNPVCNLGHEVRAHWGESLAIHKAAGLLDAMRPLLIDFSRYGMRDGAPPRNIRLPGGRTQLLADAVSTLYTHYSEAPANIGALNKREIPAVDVQFGTGFRRAEKHAFAMVRQPPQGGDSACTGKDILSLQTCLGAHLQRTGVCLADRDQEGICPPGRLVNAADELVAFLGWLLDRDDFFTPRPARFAEWGTSLVEKTHRRGVRRGSRIDADREPRPSRIHLIVEAFRLIDDRLAAAGNAEAAHAWRDLDLLDLISGVDDQGYLANPGAVHGVRGLTSILADVEARAWQDADPSCDPLGGVACPAYLHELEVGYEKTRDFLSTKGLSETVDFLGKIREDPRARRWLDVLLRLQVRRDGLAEGEVRPDGDVAGALLELIANTIQTAATESDVNEVLRYLGKVMEREHWFSSRVVFTLGELRAADPDKIVPALIDNLTTEDRSRLVSRYPARTLKDVLLDAHRIDPARSMPTNPPEQRRYDAADYRAVVQRMRDFVLDREHGFHRIIDVVVSREPPELRDP